MRKYVAAPTANGTTANQIQSWITQAMQADDDSLAFRRGIHVLQNLLLTMRPETTALLPNYPNPSILRRGYLIIFQNLQRLR